MDLVVSRSWCCCCCFFSSSFYLNFDTETRARHLFQIINVNCYGFFSVPFVIFIFNVFAVAVVGFVTFFFSFASHNIFIPVGRKRVRAGVYMHLHSPVVRVVFSFLWKYQQQQTHKGKKALFFFIASVLKALFTFYLLKYDTCNVFYPSNKYS